MKSHLIKKLRGSFPNSITPEQAKDTGMAMVLICLLTAILAHVQVLIIVAIFLLIIDMIWPRFFRPMAYVWFGISRILGGFVSKILFGLIFALLVIPLGLIRRILGKDPLQLTKWKSGNDSVFRVRDHVCASCDIAHPY